MTTRAFRPPLAAAILSLTAFLVLMALGIWQVQRLEWKTAMLAVIHDSMQKPPVPLPEDADKSWEYRRVTLAGHFLYDHEFLLGPRTLDGVSGYHMIVPFQRLSGGEVLVDRGWVSDATMSKVERPQGTLKIEGIVQLPHPGSFTPDNNPAKGAWFWADISAMAAAAHLDHVAPVLVNIAEKKEGVYPVAGKVEVNIPNDHKQYAIFWFAMAFVSQIIFYLRFRNA